MNVNANTVVCAGCATGFVAVRDRDVICALARKNCDKHPVRASAPIVNGIDTRLHGSGEFGTGWAGAKVEARYPNLCSGENFGYFGFTLTRSLYDSQALQAYSQNSHTHSPYAGRHTLGQQRHRSHHHLALVKGTTVGCAHCGQVLSATLARRAHDS